jgi:hypothetical protein
MEEKTCQGCIWLSVSYNGPICGKMKIYLNNKDLEIPVECEGKSENKNIKP